MSAYNAVEKMKAEQEVDVYNSALMARYRRPHFIRTLVSICYSSLFNLPHLQPFGWLRGLISNLLSKSAASMGRDPVYSNASFIKVLVQKGEVVTH